MYELSAMRPAFNAFNLVSLSFSLGGPKKKLRRLNELGHFYVIVDKLKS